MQKRRQGQKHWDHNSGSNRQPVTFAGLCNAFTFRPGLVLMIYALAAGVLVSWEIASFAGVIIIVLLSVFILYAFCLAGGSIRSSIAWFYLLICPVTIFIYCKSEAVDRFNRTYSQEVTGKIIDLEGTVVSVPNLYEPDQDWGSVKLRLTNGCLLSLTGKISELAYGDYISAKASIEQPEHESNPGGFSMRNHANSQGIYITGKVVLAQELTILRRGSIWHRIRAAVAVRSTIRDVVRSFLDEEQAELLLAIFVGDDSLLDQNVKISFRRSGLAHLTSVSGSHVSFVVIPITLIAGLFKLGKKSTAAVQIALLLIYGTISGWSVGVSRAAIILSIIIILKVMERNNDSINSLGIVCALMIFRDIYIVMQIGFWLSVCAAAILTIFAVPCGDWLRTVVLKRTNILLPDAFIHSFCAVVLLQILLIPLTANLAGEIFWLSWLYNMPAISLVSLICILSVFVIPLMLIVGIIPDSSSFSMIIEFLKTASGLMLDSPLRMLSILAKAGSVNQTRTPTSDFNIMILIGGVLLVTAFWFRFVRPNVFSFGSFSLWAGTILLMVGMTFANICKLNSPDWKLYFLDVGQGDSLLMLNRKASISILIDGGPEGSGYYDIEPAMRKLGICKIDLAIVTHGHADHIYGVIELVELGLVEKIAVSQIALISAQAYESEPVMQQKTKSDFQELDLTYMLLKKCTDLSIPVQHLKKHDTITLPGEAVMTVLAPDDNVDLSAVRDDQNMASLIIEFSYGDYITLLLADLAEKQEKAMSPDWSQADLIKVAHHGSRLTTQEHFIDKVKPQHAIISTGPNFYGHPSPDVIDRLTAVKCTIWRTDTHGCVMVEYKKKKASISVYKR